MSEPTHELWSRPLYEEGDWVPLDADKPVLAFVTVAGEVVTIRLPEKVRFHDEREYQFRPCQLTPLSVGSVAVTALLLLPKPQAARA